MFLPESRSVHLIIARAIISLSIFLTAFSTWVRLMLAHTLASVSWQYSAVLTLSTGLVPSVCVMLSGTPYACVPIITRPSMPCIVPAAAFYMSRSIGSRLNHRVQDVVLVVYIIALINKSPSITVHHTTPKLHIEEWVVLSPFTTTKWLREKDLIPYLSFYFRH